YQPRLLRRAPRDARRCEEPPAGVVRARHPRQPLAGAPPVDGVARSRRTRTAGAAFGAAAAVRASRTCSCVAAAAGGVVAGRARHRCRRGAVSALVFDPEWAAAPGADHDRRRRPRPPLAGARLRRYRARRSGPREIPGRRSRRARPRRDPALVRRRSRVVVRASAGTGADRPRLDLAQARRQPDRVCRAAEADQPGACVKPAALFVVLAAAKAAGLWGHHLARSGWTPIAYLWHDAAVVLAFAALDAWLAHRERTAWIVYAALAGYAAGTIPVVRVPSTPVTVSMWRATSGTIADSIRLYATPTNLLLIAMVSALACIAPLCTARVSRARLAAPLALCAALGPSAAARVDTLGLERNAWTALAATMTPHVSAGVGDAEWRSSRLHRARP